MFNDDTEKKKRKKKRKRKRKKNVCCDSILRDDRRTMIMIKNVDTSMTTHGGEGTSSRLIPDLL